MRDSEETGLPLQQNLWVGETQTSDAVLATFKRWLRNLFDFRPLLRNPPLDLRYARQRQSLGGIGRPLICFDERGAMAGADSGDEVIIAVRKTTTRRPVIALEVKTLFNAVQPLRGFICEDATLVREGTHMRIDITLREDRRSHAHCGCCAQLAPGYDRQRERSWLSLVTMLGLLAIMPVDAAYVSDGNFQPVWAGGESEPAEGPDWNDDEGDSVPNWLEAYFQTAAWIADTDSDGLSDWDEFFGSGTNPVLWDTNGNGFSDADDLIQPPDSDNAPPQPAADDFDGDGLPDLWELAYALNAYDPSDTTADPDDDSLTNLEEYQHATDPNTWDDATALVSSGPPPGTTADEDQDGLPDLWELANGLNPNDASDIADDPDGDFIFNIEEYQHGTDPQVADDYTTVMGYPIDTASLSRQDDGTERDADWDNDGSDNITELQNGSDPRESSASSEPPPDDSQCPAEEESEGETPPDDQLSPEGDAYEDSNEEVGEGETQPPPPTDKTTYVEDNWEFEFEFPGQETTDDMKKVADALGKLYKTTAPGRAATATEIAATGFNNMLSSTGTNFKVVVKFYYHAEKNGVKIAGSEGTLSGYASEDGQIDKIYSVRSLIQDAEEGNGMSIMTGIDQKHNQLQVELNSMNQ